MQNLYWITFQIFIIYCGATFKIVSSPLDDLCINIWISAMIICLSIQRDRGQQCTNLCHAHWELA